MHQPQFAVAHQRAREDLVFAQQPLEPLVGARLPSLQCASLVRIDT